MPPTHLTVFGRRSSRSQAYTNCSPIDDLEKSCVSVRVNTWCEDSSLMGLMVYPVFRFWGTFSSEAQSSEHA